MLQARSSGDAGSNEALEVAEGCLELQMALVHALQSWPQVRCWEAHDLSLQLLAGSNMLAKYDKVSRTDQRVCLSRDLIHAPLHLLQLRAADTSFG